MNTTTKTPAQAMTVQQTKPSAAQLATVQRKAKALEILGDTLKIDPPMLMQILKNQIMPKASDDEIAAIVIISNVYGLNPILRELYAFPDPKRNRIVPVVGVDGWSKIVNRHDDYDGCQFEWQFDADGAPISCTCKLYHKKRSHPIEVTEYFEECKRSTDPWTKMPKRMLRHKAFIQAVRLAFSISGIYDEDEAQDIVVTDANVTAAPLIAAPSFITQPPTAQDEPFPASAPANVAPLPEDEDPLAEPPQKQTPPAEAAKVDPTAHLDTAGVINMIKESAKREGVSDDQITGHMRASKMAKKDQHWDEMSDSKLRSLANGWARELEAIKSIVI